MQKSRFPISRTLWARIGQLFCTFAYHKSIGGQGYVGYAFTENNQRLTYNPFAKLPEVYNVLADTSESDCRWALWTLFETLVGSHEESEVLLDYLAAHWQ